MQIKNHKELRVWQEAVSTAMNIFEITKTFPSEEKYSLVDQIRRSSRSVAANLAEAWRKRRYKTAFISKLSDAESEACETQTWLEFSVRCNYLNKAKAAEIEAAYEKVIGQIITMIHRADRWLLPPLT